MTYNTPAAMSMWQNSQLQHVRMALRVDEVQHFIAVDA